MISFYLGVAARRPFLDRSTSWVPAANPSGTFLHIRHACGHMPNIKLSGFNPSHVSFHASPFHCLPPLLPCVVAWLLPSPSMRCVRVQPAHWSLPLLSCKLCNLPCLSFPSPWSGSLCMTWTLLLVRLVSMRGCTGPFNYFFSLVRVAHVCGSSIDGLRPACIKQE
jgi:hypothetical protein